MSCTPKNGGKNQAPIPGDFVLGGKAPCAIPVLVKSENPNEQPKLVGEPFEVQFGYESEAQKKNWTKKGFPKAQLVHQGSTVPIPVKGLAGDLINPIGGTIEGNLCQGIVGVMDAIKRVWLVFGQGEANKVVMMAYDPQHKKFVDGHAPAIDIFGISFEKSTLFYMTASRVTEPKKQYVKLGEQEIAVREMAFPYWVRIDLAGRVQAQVDPQKTYASSAFRPLFDKPEEFHQYFGRDDNTGMYTKKFVYVTNLDSKACLMAATDRREGEISAQQMYCRNLPVPAAKNQDQGGKKPASEN